MASFHDALVGHRWSRFRVIDETALMRESLNRRRVAAEMGEEPEEWALYPTPQIAFDHWRTTGEIIEGCEVVECDDPERL